MSVVRQARVAVSEARRLLRHRCRAQARTLAELAARTDGTLAVHARHLGSGRTLSLGAGRRCKLASVSKVPLAIHILDCVEGGRIGLDVRIEIEDRHVCRGSGVIASRLRVPGIALSVDNLLRLALTMSDNTATDVLFELGGGPEAVQASLDARGHGAIRVDRTISDLVEAASGTRGRSFYDDDLDTASPEALVALLADLWTGALLPPVRTDHLIEILGSCKTGDRRFRGHIPYPAVVAQKTGTLLPEQADNLIADAGVIELPDGGGHVAIAAFLTGATRPTAEQENVVAHVARIAYETFQSSPT